MSRNLLQGLVGAWCPSLGPSGYTLLDRSGRGNHGTLTNMDAGSDWVGMPGGWALDFDGTNDSVAITTRAISISTNFTLYGWAYRTAGTSNRNIIGIGSGATGFWTLYWQSASGRYAAEGWDLTNNVTITETTNAGLNVWTQVVMSASAGLFRIYTDGILRASATNTHSQTAQTVITIGNLSGYSSWFQGDLDDLACWNRGITAGEVWQLYQLGRGGLGRLLTQRAQRRVFRTAQGNRRRRLICGAEC